MQTSSQKITSTGTTVHPRTYTLTQTFLTNQIRNRARTKEKQFSNWPDHPRRKGFEYHWKWGRCDCITSGSAELVKCLWWRSDSILQIACVLLTEDSNQAIPRVSPREHAIIHSTPSALWCFDCSTSYITYVIYNSVVLTPKYNLCSRACLI